MKNICTFLALLLLPVLSFGQVFNGTVYIPNQAYLDTMTQWEVINGPLYLGYELPNDIHDLSNLSNLKYVQDLFILHTQLKDLSGLDSLQFLDAYDFEIAFNDSLLNLDGLGNIFGGALCCEMNIHDNPKLERLTNFHRLNGYLKHQLRITDNPKLTTLVGLDSLKGSRGIWLSHNQLKNLKGLGAYKRIITELSVVGEDSLQTIEDFALTESLGQGVNSRLGGIGMQGCNSLTKVKLREPLIGQKSYIAIQDCEKTDEIVFDSFMVKDFGINVNNCPNIAKINYLRPDTFSFYVNNCTKLNEFTFPNVNRMKSMWLEACPQVKYMELLSNTDTTYRFPFEDALFGQIYFIDNDSLESINLNNLFYITKLKVLNNSQLTNIVIPNIKEAFSIDIQNNFKLKDITGVNELRTVWNAGQVSDPTHYITNHNLNFITIIQHPALGGDTTYLGKFDGLRKLERCSLLELRTKGQFLSDFDSLKYLHFLYLSSDENSRIIQFPALDSIRGFGIRDCKLKTLPSFQSSIQMANFGVIGMDSLTSFDGLSNIPKLTEFWANSAIGTSALNSPLLSDCSVICQWEQNGNNIFDSNQSFIDNNLLDCKDKTALELFCTSLSVEEIAQTSPWVFPNPFVESLYIDLSGLPVPEKIQEICIFDSLGRIVKHLFVDAYDVRLNFGEISSGLYFLTIKAEDGLVLNKRLVKMNN